MANNGKHRQGRNDGNTPQRRRMKRKKQMAANPRWRQQTWSGYRPPKTEFYEK
ncbi:MAG: hypothetical protein K8S55_04340 [Phycisphaerae bacterium]|nr:hypothetical protein [Phycisphaerae bacterium]